MQEGFLLPQERTRAELLIFEVYYTLFYVTSQRTHKSKDNKCWEEKKGVGRGVRVGDAILNIMVAEVSLIGGEI